MPGLPAGSSPRAQRALADALERIGAPRLGGARRKPRPDERYVKLAEPRLVVAFTVPGVPVPKARPRLGRNGNTYTPKKTLQGEYTIQEFCWIRYPHLRPQPGRFHLKAAFYLPGGQRADWDNMGKTVSDALNDICWFDDRQVGKADVEIELFAQEPRTEITVWLTHLPERALR